MAWKVRHSLLLIFTLLTVFGFVLPEKDLPKLVPKFHLYISKVIYDIPERTTRGRFSFIGLWRNIIPNGINDENPI